MRKVPSEKLWLSTTSHLIQHRDSNLPKPNSYPQPTNHPKHTQNAQAPNPALSYQFSRVGFFFALRVWIL